MTASCAAPAPLAELMRPERLDDFVGQSHLLSSGKPLRIVFDGGQLHSMVFWGPPGTGKTTLARLLSRYCQADFIQLSAVLAGVKEVREAVGKARKNWQSGQRRTVLFVDEVHRFNKAQQDAFLPFVEDGTFFFIGATTENPGFSLNNALLSRVRVYLLKRLACSELTALLQRTLHCQWPDLKTVAPDHLRQLSTAADGDARQALILLEMFVQLLDLHDNDEQAMAEVVAGRVRRFDNRGDLFYQQISALHKSVRGSNPDAALYWLARMLDGGCDPLYIARRVLRMASEDIGNADPRALTLALNAWQVYERLGSPEGELALAQAVTYLAVSAKSNAVYEAFKSALGDAEQNGTLPVPDHLRNAPVGLMKRMGFGKGYRYAHDEEDGFAAGVHYFPDDMSARQYYHPVDRGLEIRVGQRLSELRNRDEERKKSSKN